MAARDVGDANTRLGILLMVAGILLFALNDALGKWLVATYSVGQLLLVRSGAAMLVLAPAIARKGWRSLFRVERPLLHVFRVIVSSAEVYLFYYAVMYLPLADTMTYWLAAPIYVAALSPLLLGEHVGWRRWTAIFVGFLGVIIALRPSTAVLSPAAIVAIMGSLAFAMMFITSRILRGTPDVTLVFWQIFGAGVLGLVMAPLNWTPIDPVDFVLLMLLGIVAMGAHVCVNRALKFGDAATIIPFQYTQLLWGVVLGWVFFSEIPSVQLLVGAIFIIGAGLFIFFRERQLKKPTDEVMEI